MYYPLPSKARILLSRTDNLGDVLLTLPLCGFLKRALPDIHLIFLAKRYTAEVLRQCEHLDEVWCWEDFQGESERAAQGRCQSIDYVLHLRPDRVISQYFSKALKPSAHVIGTSSRWYHFLSCHSLAVLPRKSSDDHEAQLNLGLLRAMGFQSHQLPSFDHLAALCGLHAPALTAEEGQVVAGLHLAQWPKEKWILLHPLSHGSAQNWPLEHYGALVETLAPQGYRFLVSGGPKEEPALRAYFGGKADGMRVIAGETSLRQLMVILTQVGLVIAASTGPLHLASLLGTPVIGLFPGRRPMHAGRWRPLGFPQQILSSSPAGHVRDVTPQQVEQAMKHLLELAIY